MKKILIMTLAAAMVTGPATLSRASDWDKAGKALTIIEGLRLISGGRIDVVGKIGEIATGRTYSKNTSYGKHHHRSKYDRYKNYGHYRRDHKPYKKVVKHYCDREKAWVPRFHWVKKYVPEHEEYDERFGKVIVEGHYIKVKKETGGHWEYYDTCDGGYYKS